MARLKLLLVSSQLVCLLAVLLSGSWRIYRIFVIYLIFALAATAAFRSEAPWLESWYVWLDTPVVILRFAAALECLHWQTEKYRDWMLLMGAVFLLGNAAQEGCWLMEVHTATGLDAFVVLRRSLHIWMGSICAVVQLFWIFYQWSNRRANWWGLAFSCLCWNHAAVAVASVGRTWGGLSWWRAAPWSWACDALFYLAIAVICLRVPVGLQTRQYWR